jgi:hypothetical protein
MTGHSSEDDLVKEALSSGALGVISKPFGDADSVVNYLHNFFKDK